MSRSFALAMTRPHERLGIPMPLGRRLPHGLIGWNMLIAGLTFVLVIGYIVQVNRASARGFTIRDYEKKVETLRTDVMRFEDTIATLSSVQALTGRANTQGFVAVDRLEYVNPASKAYALAK